MRRERFVIILFMLDQLTRVLKIGGILSSDFIILATVFVVFFIYALYFGKNRIISFIISFYPAVFLYKIFPFGSKLIILQGDKLIALNKIIIFFIFFLPLNIIINRYITGSGNANFHPLRLIGFAVAGLALTLIFSYSIIDLSLFYHFSTPIEDLFSGATRIFLWNLLPLAILAIL